MVQVNVVFESSERFRDVWDKMTVLDPGVTPPKLLGTRRLVRDKFPLDRFQ